MTETLPADDRLLTLREVADYLQIPKATLYTWRVDAQGPSAFKIGKHLRYRKSVVDAWLEQQVA